MMFEYMKEHGPIKDWTMLKGLVLLIAVALMASLSVAGVAAEPPQERDYFGIVLSRDEDLLVISVDGTTVEIPTSDDTEVRLPFKRDASLTDLVPGDSVAVSLEEEDGLLVADKVYLIPGKTQVRHLPGEVISVSDTEITIQPVDEGAAPLVFTRSSATEINFHKGTTELVAGSFVIIVAVRDEVTGELLLDAREIHVTLMRESDEDEDPVVEELAIVNTAEIQGGLRGRKPGQRQLDYQWHRDTRGRRHQDRGRSCSRSASGGRRGG